MSFEDKMVAVMDQALAKSRKMTPQQRRELLFKAGIFTKSGEVAPRYRNKTSKKARAKTDKAAS